MDARPGDGRQRVLTAAAVMTVTAAVTVTAVMAVTVIGMTRMMVMTAVGQPVVRFLRGGPPLGTGGRSVVG